MEVSESQSIVRTAYEKMLSSKKIRYDVEVESDIRNLKGILGKYRKRMVQLTGVPSKQVPKEKLHKAKQNYINYYIISKRNPEIISESIKLIMESLLRTICLIEEDLLENYIKSNASIERNEAYDALEKVENYGKIEFMTCEAVIRCYVRNRDNESLIGDITILSVFIDETLKVDEIGSTKAICNFSYIIAEGNLKKSAQLKKTKIVEYGVAQSSTVNNMELITLEGIAYVLNKLAFKYNYYNQVKIIIDNDQALKKWNKIKGEYKLVDSFGKVDVISVNRKYNVAADLLCRKNIVISLNRKEYEHLKSLRESINDMNNRPILMSLKRQLLRHSLSKLDSLGI